MKRTPPCVRSVRIAGWKTEWGCLKMIPVYGMDSEQFHNDLWWSGQMLMEIAVFSIFWKSLSSRAFGEGSSRTRLPINVRIESIGADGRRCVCICVLIRTGPDGPRTRRPCPVYFVSYWQYRTLNLHLSAPVSLYVYSISINALLILRLSVNGFNRTRK